MLIRSRVNYGEKWKCEIQKNVLAEHPKAEFILHSEIGTPWSLMQSHCHGYVTCNFQNYTDIRPILR